MKIVTKEHTVFFDVDDTLVMHNPLGSEFRDIVYVPDPLGGTAIRMRSNTAMIRLLKEEAFRGAHVVVWSRGGYEWAATVVKALKLEKQVDQIMTKPYAYFDDKPVEEWLPYRVYIGPNTKYKK